MAAWPQIGKIRMTQPLATIGTRQDSISYADRHTVKAVIVQEGKILLLNNGLLPGGGVENGETTDQALQREVKEEIGAEVERSKMLGRVIQYRDFLAKRYIVEAYVCSLKKMTEKPNPQDKGEAAFRMSWLSVGEALQVVNDSVKKLDHVTMTDDVVQGKLYNIKTTQVFLRYFKEVQQDIIP